MLVLFSFPNAPSVKYNGYIYSTEGDCEFARYELQEVYKQKLDTYKMNTKIESYCLEFESFPISGLNKINLGV
jgi:hypothetical protein